MTEEKVVNENENQSNRPQWPNAHLLPEQLTLKARFHRNFSLILFYFFWVCGLGLFSGLWLYTFFCFARTAITLNAVPIPVSVHAYLVFIVLYESYHYVVHSKGQPMWPFIRNYVRLSGADYPYFRHQIVIFEGREEESLKDPRKPMVEPNSKALYAYHPHGVLSAGFGFNGVHSLRFKESQARWLVAENLFWFPILRDILHWLEFDNVAKNTFVRYMKQGRVLSLIPGGFEEATLYERGKHRVYIKKRFGFIKLALQHGYKIHPIYTFGEEETFHAFPYLLKFRLQLNAWKIPGVAFFGRVLCFFLPLQDLDLTTVVGKPLELPLIENPTKEEVAKYHQQYIDALVGVFDRNKSKYAIDPTATLEVY